MSAQLVQLTHGNIFLLVPQRSRDRLSIWGMRMIFSVCNLDIGTTNKYQMVSRMSHRAWAKCRFALLFGTTIDYLIMYTSIPYEITTQT